LFFRLPLENTITRVQVNQEGLKLNGTYQPLVYAEDVPKLGSNLRAIKKNTDTSKGAGNGNCL